MKASVLWMFGLCIATSAFAGGRDIEVIKGMPVIMGPQVVAVDGVIVLMDGYVAPMARQTCKFKELVGDPPKERRFYGKDSLAGLRKIIGKKRVTCLVRGPVTQNERYGQPDEKGMPNSVYKVGECYTEFEGDLDCKRAGFRPIQHVCKASNGQKSINTQMVSMGFGRHFGSSDDLFNAHTKYRANRDTQWNGKTIRYAPDVCGQTTLFRNRGIKRADGLPLERNIDLEEYRQKSRQLK